MKRMIGLLVFVFSLMSVSQASAADDITGHWAEDHMRALAKRGIMLGTGPNQYSPDQHVTRAQFATLITRALNLPASNKSFPDLNQAHPTLHDGVKRAAGVGIVKGGTDGNFYPINLISRQEMAVMVDRAMAYKGKQSTKSTLPFKDAASILYKEEVGRIAGVSIIIGTENNLFLPYDSSTRAMAAVVLSRMLSHLEGAPIVEEKPKPEVPKLPLVVIDPGHGGHDSGTRGNGLMEKDIILDVSKRLKPMLEAKGIPAIYTRQTDVFIELGERAAIANRANADIFVSIHANSATDVPTANGVETYFYKGLVGQGGSSASVGKPVRTDSEAVATYIQKRLLKHLQLGDRGVRNQDFKVLRETNMAAVLAEIGFVSNAGDSAKLSQPAFRQQIAEALCGGIVDYLTAKGYKL